MCDLYGCDWLKFALPRTGNSLRVLHTRDETIIDARMIAASIHRVTRALAAVTCTSTAAVLSDDIDNDINHRRLAVFPIVVKISSSSSSWRSFLCVLYVVGKLPNCRAIKPQRNFAVSLDNQVGDKVCIVVLGLLTVTA